MTASATDPTLIVGERTGSNEPVYAMAAVCFAMGCIQVLATGVNTVFWASMIALTLVGLVSFVRLLTVPFYVTPWSIYATSIAMGYGLGTLNTVSRGYTHGLSLLEVTYANLEHVALAEGLILLVVGVLLLAGTMDKKKLLPPTNFTDVEKRAAILLLVVSALTAIVGVITGNIGYGGGQGSEEGSGRVSPVGAILVSSMTATMATGVFIFAKEPDRRLRLTAFLLCAALLGPILLGGRRSFIFAIVVASIALFTNFGVKALLNKRTILLLVIAGLGVMSITRFYFAMRLASYKLDARPSLVELVKGGWDIVTNAEAEGLDEANAENQGTRTFIIGYVGELLERGHTDQILLGDLLKVDVATAVPTLIWPGKWKVMQEIGSEEYACHSAFGMPVWDAANNTITAGFCDFWYPGMFLYPIGVMIFFMLVNRAFSRAPIVVRSLVCFATAEALFQVETTITAYLSGLRNLSILALMAWAVILVMRYVDSLPLVQHKRAQKALHKQRLAELRKGVA